MIKRLREDLKKGKWYAVKECFFHLHSGRKTYIVCLGNGLDDVYNGTATF